MDGKEGGVTVQNAPEGAGGWWLLRAAESAGASVLEITDAHYRSIHLPCDALDDESDCKGDCEDKRAGDSKPGG